MGKLMYETPVMREENFEANEYVAACLSLYCSIPGGDSDHCFDGGQTRYGEDRLWHGVCQDDNGYNPERQSEGKGSKIFNVKLGNEAAGGSRIDTSSCTRSVGPADAVALKNNVYYFATWQSDDINSPGTIYKHRGLAKVSDSANHS